MEDLACVIHLHSTHSDGTGTVDEIAAAAEACGLDVVLLTDHDTLAADDAWYESVLLLVGHEVSPKDRNHFLAFGTGDVVDHARIPASEIPSAVRSTGGFGFAAHPFSQGNPALGRAAKAMPTDDLSDVDGIELWNFVGDSAEQFRGWRDAARFIASPERWMPELPQRNVDAWDELCRRRPVVAIGGLDAHQVGIRVAGHVPLRLMSYRRSFRMLTTHVLVESPLSGDVASDRAMIFEALRSGRCYIARDWVAPARGFTFDGMGGQVALSDGPRLRARLPRPADVRLLRAGEVVASAAGAAELDHAPDAPGPYRVEARLGGRLWIMSNPVYVA